MAAIKHSIAESDEPDCAVRPVKKSKTADNGEMDEKARLKQEKREKKEKKEKKRKLKAEAEKAIEPDQVVGDEEAVAKAEKKARKEEKKKQKKEKKARKQEDSAAEKEATKSTKEKKEKKAKKKDKPASAAATPKNASYQQTTALNAVPQAEIDAFLEKNQITITDPNQTDSGSPLRPILEFAHLPPTELLTKKGSPFAKYTTPTPIQSASWPYTLSGRDVVGIAETGSGKTMAFALPCVQAVAAATSERGTTRAVIVSPTRELAMQTHEQLAALAALASLRCVCLYGGASKDAQRAQLARGADVVVATPGRLRDFMSDGTVELGGCRFAVLDEADRMLDTGFEEDIRQILGSCPPCARRQTLMFTATWPASVQTLASTLMKAPVRVTISSGGREGDGNGGGGGGVELQANTRITQRVEVVESADKETRLLQLVKRHQQGGRKDDRILVFCLYKKEATRVENFLAKRGVRVGGIHGDLRQEQRTRSLEAFKSGQTPVLVATDVAARGLDIPEVKLVINVTDYVHRIGRTGRAGKTGEAVTFFTAQDKGLSGSLVNVLKGANQPVPDELLKFGTTVKKKTHDMYGSFFKDVDMTQKATKITFD